MRNQPLVSIVTPVYNGAQFLVECIESVLAQSYSNFEYIIVNNASTDNTGEIAEKYSLKDKRIRVFHNDLLLPIISNHNYALSLISPESKYCKIVSGDDWIYPECVALMVRFADAHPSVAIVGSYQVSGGDQGWCVRNTGLPVSQTLFSGREIGRKYLLENHYVLGNPTTNLFRCVDIRRGSSFFPNDTAEADVSACLNQLGHADFGFIHQVLSYERVHVSRITTASLQLHAYSLSKIADLCEYGALFMNPDEQAKRLNVLMREYYDLLAISVTNMRERAFWAHHEKRLNELGFPLNRTMLAKAVIVKIFNLLMNPKQTTEKLLRHMNIQQAQQVR
jgi:glycosyltransferase involved in cell wall biosynthesis